MKKAILILIITCFVLTGCAQELVVDESGAVVSESITNISSNNQALIFKDIKTGCRYMEIVANQDYNASIVQMLGKDGLPDCGEP